MTVALTYSELEMPRVDAQLERDRELLVVLPSGRGQVLIALIETSRGLLRAPGVAAKPGR